MVQATVETEDLRQFNAANWFQLEAYLKQKALMILLSKWRGESSY
jgi:hypothetical protein